MLKWQSLTKTALRSSSSTSQVMRSFQLSLEKRCPSTSQPPRWQCPKDGGVADLWVSRWVIPVMHFHQPVGRTWYDFTRCYITKLSLIWTQGYQDHWRLVFIMVSDRFLVGNQLAPKFSSHTDGKPVCLMLQPQPKISRPYDNSPLGQLRDKILEEVAANRVTIIVAPTGCGKSTRSSIRFFWNVFIGTLVKLLTVFGWSSLNMSRMCLGSLSTQCSYECHVYNWI